MKRYLFAGLIIALIAIISGCFMLKTKSMENSHISASIIENTLQITSRGTYSGIELSIKKLIQDDDVSTSPGFLRIVSQDSERTIIAITKTANEIQPGELLLSIKGEFESIQELEIQSNTVLLENKFLPSATQPFPDGISIVDAQLDRDSNGFFLIHGKSINNLGGSEIYITFDQSLFSIDTNKGNEGVEALGTYASGMLIVKNYSSGLLITSAFQEESGKNIEDEDIYRVYVNTFEEGIAKIQIGGEVRDSNTELIGVTFTGGSIEIGGPKLLGDFNDNEKVDLVDFINFAHNYGTVFGDNRYSELYDIAPAEDHYGGRWAGIYDKCDPDGMVDLLDFIIFARNYGKSKPANRPPAAPSNPTPTDGATGVSLTPTLSWECSDPDGDTLIYDVYFGTEGTPELVSSGQPNSLYETGALLADTVYFWRIVAEDTRGAVTESKLWSFRTSPMYEISVFSNPEDCGTVFGGGMFLFGEEVTLEAEPNECYMLEGWFDDGVLVSQYPKYIFEADSARVLEARFTKAVLYKELIFVLENLFLGRRYEVTLELDPRITKVRFIYPDIDPEADTPIPEEALPDEEGKVEITSFWTNNDATAVVILCYVGDELVSQCTADLSKEAFTVLATAGENGTVDPEGETVVDCGDDLLFTFTPDEGYGVDQVTVDGAPVDVVGSPDTTDKTYNLEDIRDNHAIDATFKQVFFVTDFDFQAQSPLGNIYDVHIEVDPQITLLKFSYPDNDTELPVPEAPVVGGVADIVNFFTLDDADFLLIRAFTADGNLLAEIVVELDYSEAFLKVATFTPKKEWSLPSAVFYDVHIEVSDNVDKVEFAYPGNPGAEPIPAMIVPVGGVIDIEMNSVDFDADEITVMAYSGAELLVSKNFDLLKVIEVTCEFVADYPILGISEYKFTVVVDSPFCASIEFAADSEVQVIEGNPFAVPDLGTYEFRVFEASALNRIDVKAKDAADDKIAERNIDLP